MDFCQCVSMSYVELRHSHKQKFLYSTPPKHLRISSVNLHPTVFKTSGNSITVPLLTPTKFSATATFYVAFALLNPSAHFLESIFIITTNFPPFFSDDFHSYAFHVSFSLIPLGDELC
jgi:hypothetical protein